MADAIRWTHAEMIETACEWWDDPTIAVGDCEVRRSTDGDDSPCLVVVHAPSGKTSAEAGDGGRWHLDGTAYEA